MRVTLQTEIYALLLSAYVTNTQLHDTADGFVVLSASLNHVWTVGFAFFDNVLQEPGGAYKIWLSGLKSTNERLHLLIEGVDTYAFRLRFYVNGSRYLSIQNQLIQTTFLKLSG